MKNHTFVHLASGKVRGARKWWTVTLKDSRSGHEVEVRLELGRGVRI
jgi:hypothetical protein